MKFTCSVEIKQPIARVTELFDAPNNLKEWQDGFVGIEHLSGRPGQPGAKSKLIYNIKNKEMELIETIIKKDLPREFSATYEHEHMTNTMSNRFTSLGSNLTKYDAEIEYTQFNGFLVKMMAFLFPGMFKKQVQKWLDQFKAFAEKADNG